MKRKTRTNVFLLAMVVLLAVAAFAELRRERAIAFDPLTHLDVSSIRTLAIRCRDCKARRFEKVDGHWRMREPDDAPADDARIGRLAAIANAPVRFRHAAGELEPGKVGLDPPLATLELDGLVLKFGSTDAIHDDRYVEVGDSIALVPDRFSALLFEAPESELARVPAH